MVSGIVGRNDEHHKKGMDVNTILKTKCIENSLNFIDNSNISINKHLNGSGLHLNFNGTVRLANNFLDAIKV